jgi:polyisoprenoid-binding protein YceI
MRKRRLLAIAMLAYGMSGVMLRAQTSMWTIDAAHSSAEFQVRHLGVSNVRGTITAIKGMVMLDEKDIAKSSVTATLDATTVNTSVDARDKDLKSENFFDIAKFPTLSFKSTSFQRTNGKLQMTGDLTLHGVTKPITLDVDGPAPPQKAMGKTVSGFSANGILHRSDFGFGSKYGPPMVGDDVKITIDVEIDKQP